MNDVVGEMRKDTSLFGRFAKALWAQSGAPDEPGEEDAFMGVWWTMMNLTPRAICEAALVAKRSESDV